MYAVLHTVCRALCGFGVKLLFRDLGLGGASRSPFVGPYVHTPPSSPTGLFCLPRKTYGSNAFDRFFFSIYCTQKHNCVGLLSVAVYSENDARRLHNSMLLASYRLESPNHHMSRRDRTGHCWVNYFIRKIVNVVDFACPMVIQQGQLFSSPTHLLEMPFCAATAMVLLP